MPDSSSKNTGPMSLSMRVAEAGRGKFMTVLETATTAMAVMMTSLLADASTAKVATLTVVGGNGDVPGARYAGSDGDGEPHDSTLHATTGCVVNACNARVMIMHCAAWCGSDVHGVVRRKARPYRRRPPSAVA